MFHALGKNYQTVSKLSTADIAVLRAVWGTAMAAEMRDAVRIVRSVHHL